MEGKDQFSLNMSLFGCRFLIQHLLCAGVREGTIYFYLQ